MLHPKPVNKSHNKKIGLFTSLTTLALCLSSTVVAEDRPQTLDWVPLDQLTTEQRSKLPPGSCGAYISPLSHLNKNVDINDESISATSTQSYSEEIAGKKRIELIGDVVITQAYRQLTADRAVYDETTGVTTIEGEIVIREPDLVILADNANVNQTNNTVTVDNGTYAIHSRGIRGKARRIEKDSKDRLVLRGGTYTHCQPGNNLWTLKGSRIIINSAKNQGYATHARILIKGFPIFYLPYLQFPVGDERQSGFLSPSISATDDGVDISIPYYFNLAPNYDLIVTPHLLSQHGTLLEANARHLSKNFDTKIDLTHLADDKGELTSSEQNAVNNGSKTLADVAPFRGQDRWLVSIDQEGGEGKRWSSTVDYTQVSDYDYINDFSTGTLNTYSDTSLRQQLKLGYQFQNWNLTVNNQQFQTLDNTLTQPYKQLPQITFNGNYNHNSQNIFLNNEWVRFDNSDNTQLTGNRTRLNYGTEWNRENLSGFFRPRLQIQHLSYDLDNRTLASGANTKPSINVPQASIDSGLFFERAGEKALQTFEPRLFYRYSQYKDQSNLTGVGSTITFDTSERSFSYSQLFQHSRFSGGDRIDDADQISLGLTSRFISQESGLEVFKVSLGQAFYFDDRRVTLNGTPQTEGDSPVAGQISARLSEKWSLSNNFILDDNQGQIDDNSLNLRHRSNRGGLINIGYRYLRNNNPANTTDQGELSWVQPINNFAWNFVGHTRYDFTNERSLEQLLGLEYNDCCYIVRLAYKRFFDSNTSSTSRLDFDEGIILEFQLKGLGGTGKEFSSLLSDSVDGYNQWHATHYEDK